MNRQFCFDNLLINIECKTANKIFVYGERKFICEAEIELNEIRHVSEFVLYLYHTMSLFVIPLIVCI